MIAVNLLSFLICLTSSIANGALVNEKKFKIPKLLGYQHQITDAKFCHTVNAQGFLSKVFSGKEGILYCPDAMSFISKFKTSDVSRYSSQEGGDAGLLAMMKRVMRWSAMYVVMDQKFNDCMDELNKKAKGYTGDSAGLKAYIIGDDFKDLKACKKLPTFEKQFESYVNSLNSPTPGQTLAKDAWDSKAMTLVNPKETYRTREGLSGILDKLKANPTPNFMKAIESLKKEDGGTGDYKNNQKAIFNADWKYLDDNPVYQ